MKIYNIKLASESAVAMPGAWPVTLQLPCGSAIVILSQEKHHETCSTTILRELGYQNTSKQELVTQEQIKA